MNHGNPFIIGLGSKGRRSRSRVTTSLCLCSERPQHCRWLRT